MDHKPRPVLYLVVSNGADLQPHLADQVQGEYVEERLEIGSHRSAFHGSYGPILNHHVVPSLTDDKVMETKTDDEGLVVSKLTIGGLIQPGGMWIGAHYSKAQKRWCVNLIPCVTIFFVRAGGNLPKRKLKGAGGKFWI